MRLMGKVLLLLEALAGAPLVQGSDGDKGDDRAQGREVVQAFRRTLLAGQLPTLSALLMNERPHGNYDVEEMSTQILSHAWLVLRCLNHLARLDLRALQGLLQSDELHSYFNYVYTILLRSLATKLGTSSSSSSSSSSTAASPSNSSTNGPLGGSGGGRGGGSSKEDVEACLEQLLTVIGYFFLNNPETQGALQASPVLLSRLANLPFRYFCDEHYKQALFPTLLSACFPCPVNRDMLKNEMNTELLVGYLHRNMKDRDDAAATAHQVNEGPWVALARRFPEKHWADAARFFAE
jgi:hypothetical protein